MCQILNTEYQNRRKYNTDIKPNTEIQLKEYIDILPNI